VEKLRLSHIAYQDFSQELIPPPSRLASVFEPPPREPRSRSDHLLSLSDEPSPMFLEMSGDLVGG
jgi:hypothetical protein